MVYTLLVTLTTLVTTQLPQLLFTASIALTMSVTRAGAVYGLTAEEQAELESEDEDFFGEEPEPEGDSVSECKSDSDEVEEQGILDDSELQRRIIRATEQPGGEHDASSELISLDSDPFYADIVSKLSSGCACSNNCLSEFTTVEVYTFCLSLREMTKTEKDMLILGKLHAFSQTSSTIHHANRVQLGNRKRVTCDYHFDYRLHARKLSFFYMILVLNN